MKGVSKRRKLLDDAVLAAVTSGDEFYALRGRFAATDIIPMLNNFVYDEGHRGPGLMAYEWTSKALIAVLAAMLVLGRRNPLTVQEKKEAIRQFSEIAAEAFAAGLEMASPERVSEMIARERST